jgi:hypothetical protein
VNFCKFSISNQCFFKKLAKFCNFSRREKKKDGVKCTKEFLRKKWAQIATLRGKKNPDWE